MTFEGPFSSVELAALLTAVKANEENWRLVMPIKLLALVQFETSSYTRISFSTGRAVVFVGGRWHPATEPAQTAIGELDARVTVSLDHRAVWTTTHVGVVQRIHADVDAARETYLRLTAELLDPAKRADVLHDFWASRH